MKSLRQLDGLEAVALVYLALPLLVFLATWWTLPVAVTTLSLLAVVAWPALRPMRLSDGARLGRPVWLLLAACAAIWVAASGLAGWLPLDDDWQIRMVVLRDLTVGPWPVSYGPREGGEVILRFSMGYYLIPALWGKLSSVQGARAALAAWTWFGVLLLLALGAAGLRPLHRRLASVALMCLVVVCFSGMDIVGWLTWPYPWPKNGLHIEWWDPLFQFSSNTTLLFWTPNHALPAWLGAAVVWRHRDSGLAAAPMALFLASACIWSPLACIGLAPLMFACCLKGQALGTSLRQVLRPSVLAVLPVVLLVACFVTFGIPQPTLDSAARQTQEQVEMLPFLLPRLLVFGLLEWGLLAGLLRIAGLRSWILPVAALELVALPLLHFGPGNDVVMRGGIAPLLLLTLACVSVLLDPATHNTARAAVVVVLLIGTVTPWQEVQRKALPGTRWPDETRSLLDRPGNFWHYVGVPPGGWMHDFMRPPSRLPAHR